MKGLLAALSAVCLSSVFCAPTTEEPELQSEWPTWVPPGEECLPYDGSHVPDCSKFIDPFDKQPYYHEHSSNCSRFWECGPEFETCLFECAPCGCNPEVPGYEHSCTAQCQSPNGGLHDGFQWALSFDERYTGWPLGPTCVWPADYKGSCINSGGGPCDSCLEWQDCVCDLCTPQCNEDSHCPTGYVCDPDHWCVPSTVDCTVDSDCVGYDEVCNIPEHGNCYWCDGGDCVLGCGSDANCPDIAPVCGAGGGAHLCGCGQDTDCTNGLICDTDNNYCIHKPGTILLRSITLYSTSCSGCTTEGVTVSLVGKKSGGFPDGITCETLTLDKRGVDYTQGSAVFDGYNNNDVQGMLSACWEFGLNGVLNDGGSVTWVGEGTWTPEGTICVDWLDDVEYAWTCDLTASSKPGSWTLGSCKSLDKATCP